MNNTPPLNSFSIHDPLYFVCKQVVIIGDLSKGVSEQRELVSGGHVSGDSDQFKSGHKSGSHAIRGETGTGNESSYSHLLASTRQLLPIPPPQQLTSLANSPAHLTLS